MRRILGVAVVLLVGCAGGAGSGTATPSNGAEASIALPASGGSGPSASLTVTPSASSTAAPKSSAPATYTVKLGDSPGRVANELGVTVAALQAANPQITDWGQVKVGQQLNIPAGGASPTPTPEPTAPQAASTFPPLPAVAVIATGKFTGQAGGLIELSTGTTFQLRFRFDGGLLTGSGSRPLWQAPGSVVQGVKCLTWVSDKVVFTGTFDPLTRQLDGTLQAIETSTVTRTACKGDAGVAKTDATWHAQVAADGKSLSGTASVQGTQQQPFVASIKIGG